jgi:hypothetical protein
MCAEASTVLRAVAADFFFNCWCVEIPSGNRIRHIPKCVHYHVQGFRSEKKPTSVNVYLCNLNMCSLSQWPHGVKHELSSSARMLGSWGRIPLEEWISMCVCCVFVLSCVGRGLATGWSPVQGALLTVFWN